MAKIQFRSDKTKTKVFEAENSTENKTPVLFDTKSVVLDRIATEEKEEQKQQSKRTYRNLNELFKSLSDRLTLKYNIDCISVYQAEDKNDGEGRLIFKKLFGADINIYDLEKYYGFSSPAIITNSSGFMHNTMHMSRYIEKFDNRLIIVSGSAYETFRSEYELQRIRDKIRDAFKEVKKF